MTWYNTFYNTGTGGGGVTIVVCDQLSASINTTTLGSNISNGVKELLGNVNTTQLTATIESC